MTGNIIYRRVLRIKEIELTDMQRILSMDKETFKLTGIPSSKLLRLYEVDFQDGNRVKLWIYAGAIIGDKYRPGYVSCYLINKNDNKVGEEIVSSTIEGQYKFFSNNKIYLLDIIGE